MITDNDSFCLRTQLLIDERGHSVGGLPQCVLVKEEQRVRLRAPEAPDWQNGAAQVRLKFAERVN